MTLRSYVRRYQEILCKIGHVIMLSILKPCKVYCEFIQFIQQRSYRITYLISIRDAARHDGWRLDDTGSNHFRESNAEKDQDTFCHTLSSCPNDVNKITQENTQLKFQYL